MSVCLSHLFEQVSPEYGHEDEYAEQAQAPHEKKKLRYVRPCPFSLEGSLRRGGVRRRVNLGYAHEGAALVQSAHRGTAVLV